MTISALRALTDVDVKALARMVDSEYRSLFGGGPQAPTRTPSEVLVERPRSTLRHYGPSAASGGRAPAAGALPVLMVPPLAASATCYDLRPGYSLAEHFVARGRPAYLVDHGDISLRDNQVLGIEHWVETVLPEAVDTVSRRHEGGLVHLIAWSLGGIMSVATAAAHPEAPIRSVVMVSTPFDFDISPAIAPLRLSRQVTGGRVGGSLIRVVGGTPRPVNMAAFYITDPVRLVTQPFFRHRHRNDPDVIAHVDAIDALMDRMRTYPGRTIAQLYHRFVTMNEIADGRLTLGARDIDLAEVRVPVLAIAGENDQVLGPQKSIFHARSVMPNAHVALATAPGGHVGVLTGRSAPRTTWPIVDEFFAMHDPAGHVPAGHDLSVPGRGP